MIGEKEARLRTAGIEAAVEKLNGLMDKAVDEGLRIDIGVRNKALPEGRKFYTPVVVIDIALPLNKEVALTPPKATEP